MEIHDDLTTLDSGIVILYVIYVSSTCCPTRRDFVPLLNLNGRPYSGLATSLNSEEIGLRTHTSVPEMQYESTLGEDREIKA